MIWGKKKKPKVVVKKIAPYPIEAIILGDKGPISVSIPRLELTGFLANTPNEAVRTGQYYEVRFRIPVLNYEIVEKVKVVKVYFRYAGSDKSFDPLTAKADLATAENPENPENPDEVDANAAEEVVETKEGAAEPEGEQIATENASKAEHMAEMHFLNLLPENKRKIMAFLGRIGQL